MADWTNTTNSTPMFEGYAFTEMTDDLTGPFKYPRLTAMTNHPQTSLMFGVNQNREILYTDTQDLRDGNFDSVASEPFSDTTIPAAWAGGTAYTAGALVENSNNFYKALQSSTGQAVGDNDYWEPYDDFVVANSSGVFSYYGRKITSPFAQSSTGYTTVTDCLFLRDSYLSLAETGPMHLSAEHDLKQLHEIVFSFKPNSVGHLWAYAENEDGLVKGQYKGSIYGKPRVKVFMNLRGREFKIRMFIATRVDHPWQIQEVALGHIMGKGSL